MNRDAKGAFVATLLAVGMAIASSVPLLAQVDPTETSSQRQLMPDWDAERRERLVVDGERFRTPEGFRVEQVASNELVGSVVNMTFDHRGRPLLALEGAGLHILEDEDGDGLYERMFRIAEEIETAHGLYVVGPGELLVHANGPQAGTGLYRVSGWGDHDEPGRVELLQLSDGGIQEHGPHTITRGLDGSLYLLYGNHAAPDVEPASLSPLRELEEDQLLPRILDPRGHANSIVAPGGTIWRVDLETGSWELWAGGLRNPFDMAFSPEGALFVYEADMEWDRGLPWFRPTRVLHAIPGGDYGWRTGSGKIAFGNPDTLPSVADIGRGSPVGVAFYRHRVYPEEYEGALFAGDWSRGRIRVLFPRRSGATWTGDVADFVLGEPLNVTDLDIGPDGSLYFVNGGRLTSGGLFRVVWEGDGPMPQPAVGIERALRQPMPRSAWGRQQLEGTRAGFGALWTSALWRAAESTELDPEERASALELLHLDDAPLSVARLTALGSDSEALVRATVATLLGASTEQAAVPALQALLRDADALVRRRATEGLVRTSALARLASAWNLAEDLTRLLDDDDRFVRYAAREAFLQRRSIAPIVLSSLPDEGTLGSIEARLAHILQPGFRRADRVFEELSTLDLGTLSSDLLVAHLRSIELAIVRDPAPEKHAGAYEALAESALSIYPTGERASDRTLERLVAFLAPAGAVEALLGTLEQDLSQEEQIHIVYALRAMDDRFTPQAGERLVNWFDRGRRMRGAASMSGYIEALWQDALERLRPEQRASALEHRRAWDEEESRRRATLLDEPLEPGDDDLSQMSIDELAEYLEYDVMAYERYELAAGELVFQRARCADCHVFGSIGRGGGPDLSTVVSRFRRREILESIVEPSKVISDQYGAVDVELQDGGFHSGMVVDESRSALTLITANGERVPLEKSTIASRRPSEVSLMPDGLLDALSLRDLVNLIRFLEEGSEEDK